MASSREERVTVLDVLAMELSRARGGSRRVVLRSGGLGVPVPRCRSGHDPGVSGTGSYAGSIQCEGNSGQFSDTQNGVEPIAPHGTGSLGLWPRRLVASSRGRGVQSGVQTEHH